MLRALLSLVLVLMVGSLTACAAVGKPPADLVILKVTPTPTPTPTVPPEPPPPPPAEPFTLIIDDVRLSSTSNAAMFAAPEPAADEPVVRAALETARATAQTYLNAMFIDPQTRFSANAVATIIDPALLDPAALAGTGVLANPGAVLRTTTGTARATADVHVDVAQIGAISLAYSASTYLVLPDAEGPVTQQGHISIVDRGAGPQVIFLTASTTFGGTLPEVLG